MAKSHDYLLKFLLVGDADVGKNEILQKLETGNEFESPYTANGEFTFVFLCVWFYDGSLDLRFPSRVDLFSSRTCTRKISCPLSF